MSVLNECDRRQSERERMRTEVSETPGYRAHVPHLWLIPIALLALGAVYLIESFLSQRLVPGAASALQPTFDPAPGYYDQDTRVRLSAPYPGASVIFTLDGRVPTHTVGTLYSRPIRLSADAPAVTAIRARVVLPGGEMGSVASASYFVGVEASLPMMSLIADPDDLWNPRRGIYANPRERGEAWERPVDVTYVDGDRRSGFHVPAGVRIHGSGSRDFDKKSLRLYFRQAYGAPRLEYPVFPAGEVRSFRRLVLHDGGQDHAVSPWWRWTLMRNGLASSLTLELDGPASRTHPVLLFINGQPWGIYQVRERIDDVFLTDHYGIQAADILESPESPAQQAVSAGDRENWDRLLQFVETHHLADPASYAHVESQVDIANFIDYNILQIYAANTDWPFLAARRFRSRAQGGRWRWMVWDDDRSFDVRHVDLDMVQRVMDRDDPGTGGRGALLLRKLLENPPFRTQFLSRAADLLNTALAPESVVAHIDTLAAELQPDIAHETARWASSTDWQTNVEELRDFARRRPAVLRQHLVERFELGGTARLTVTPPATGSGSAAVNGLYVEELPWQGTYFRTIPVQITAAPAPGFRFVGWDPPDLPQASVTTLTVDAALTITPRFEPLGEDVPRPGDVVFSSFRMDQESHLQPDQFELLVTRSGGLDLRGWRVTDNDTKSATDEGSLVFGDVPALARVPRGTTIRIVTGHAGDIQPQDDLDAWDRLLVLHSANGNLDAHTDPGFNLGPHDNLVLLAPGPTPAFGDDLGIAFVSRSAAVTPASFGVLADGVLPIQ